MNLIVIAVKIDWPKQHHKIAARKFSLVLKVISLFWEDMSLAWCKTETMFAGQKYIPEKKVCLKSVTSLGYPTPLSYQGPVVELYRDVFLLFTLPSSL